MKKPSRAEIVAWGTNRFLSCLQCCRNCFITLERMRRPGMAVVKDAQEVRPLDGDAAFIDPFITDRVGDRAEFKAQAPGEELDGGRPLGRPVVMSFGGQVALLALVSGTE